MPKIITVQTPNGAREVPAVWVGRWLAVHRPLTGDGLSTAPRTWTVSHLSSGMVAAKCLSTSKLDAVAFAKAWDFPAAEWDSLTASASASKWPWRRRFLADRHAAAAGGPIFGPRSLSPLEQLQTAGTAAEVSAAVAAAFSAPTLSAAEESAPYPVADVLPADRVRTSEDGWPMVRWARQWWDAPTVGEVHAMALDSVAETPDGRTVEPDDPAAWPRLLGLI